MRADERRVGAEEISDTADPAMTEGSHAISASTDGMTVPADASVHGTRVADVLFVD